MISTILFNLVLVSITGLSLVIAIVGIKSVLRMKNNLKESEKIAQANLAVSENHLNYSKSEFGEIKDGVQKIQNNFESQVIPRLDSIFQNTQISRMILQSETIVSMLTQLGLKSQGNPENNSVILSMVSDTEAVNFIFGISNEDRELTVFSFSIQFPFDSAKVLAEILRLKSNYTPGGIEIDVIGPDEYFIYKDSIQSYDIVSPQLLQYTISKHLDFHAKMIEVLNANGIEKKQLTFEDFSSSVKHHLEAAKDHVSS